MTTLAEIDKNKFLVSRNELKCIMAIDDSCTISITNQAGLYLQCQLAKQDLVMNDLLNLGEAILGEIEVPTLAKFRAVIVNGVGGVANQTSLLCRIEEKEDGYYYILKNLCFRQYPKTCEILDSKSQMAKEIFDDACIFCNIDERYGKVKDMEHASI